MYTHMHDGRGRGLQEPVGVGWCACDMSNNKPTCPPGWVGSGWLGVRQWFGHYRTESTVTA